MLSSLFFVFTVSFFGIPTPTHATTPVACTADAKLCPDGVTYVGRDGNRNCQWQLCPGEKDSCAPYVCNDGTLVDRCTADGTVINYFAAPCLTHGGEVDASQSFSDVPPMHENAEAITYVKVQGIVEGYADGTYQPEQPINRAEFTKIVTGAQFNAEGTINSCLSEHPELEFIDVRTSDWFAKYICIAKWKNIIEGYPNGTFRPATFINFVESAKILIRVFVGDVEADPVWYKPYAEKLSSLHAIPTGIITFDQPITRGEMAEMIYRLKTGNTEKKSQTYEFLSLMEHCRQWLAVGGKNCE